jgi:HK97 family phage portal protein
MKATGSRFRKSFEIFNGLFDFGTGAIRNGFYPVQLGGMASPPINIARTATGDFVTPKRSLELSSVWACTWLIADTIATLPFILNQRQGNNRWGKPAFDDPLYTVLGGRPNTFMTSVEYWQFMVASKLLWGNGYSLITTNGLGDPITLSTLLPQYMVPYKTLNTGELRYKYFPSGLSTNDPMMDYSASQILHLKDRTLDGMTGLSRIEFARNSLGIARAGEIATSDVYRNGMRTNGFLSSDKTLKKDQREQLREALQKFKAGGEDSGSFMVLEAGLKFDSLTIPPQDVELLSARQFSVEDICRWFGVPPVLIGHAGSGVSMWGSGIEQLLLGFISLTLRPHIRNIEQCVDQNLVPIKKRSNFYLTIDTDDLTGADSAARSALYSSAGQNGWMTRNEIRAKEDLPPMAGGDALTVQSNLIPLDKIETMGGKPTTAADNPPPPPPPKPPAKDLRAVA